MDTQYSDYTEDHFEMVSFTLYKLYVDYTEDHFEMVSFTLYKLDVDS